jgi:hypothetical protein
MLPTKFQFIWPSGLGGEDFQKPANQKQELPVAAMFINRSGQNEQSLERTFHRCFLPSFSSFGWEVSEEKIKMWKVNGRRTPSDGKSSHCLWQGELKNIKNKPKCGRQQSLVRLWIGKKMLLCTRQPITTLHTCWSSMTCCRLCFLGHTRHCFFHLF